MNKLVHLMIDLGLAHTLLDQTIQRATEHDAYMRQCEHFYFLMPTILIGTCYYMTGLFASDTHRTLLFQNAHHLIVSKGYGSYFWVSHMLP